ncbi:MAG TPA: SAM-dependent methyltransferase [Mycobacterium sp.]|nr:SAM-dependent methyltransferase [Mycobacterium sp.]
MWEPAIGVETAAPMLAAARAVATAAGLINDRFAAPLVAATGVEFLIRVADGELNLAQLGGDGGFTRMAELFAARTGFFDNFLGEAGRAGIHQAVILGSGLDARAYRLWWPAAMTLYEVDRPRVLEFKTAVMRALNTYPNVDRRAVGADLRDDWPAALRRVGFDPAAPTVWIIEGLLVGFLSPDTQDRLLDTVTGLSVAGSRLAADHLTSVSRAHAAQAALMAERWRRRGLHIDFAGLIQPGERHDLPRYLAARGWALAEYRVDALFTAARLPPLATTDLDGAPAAVRYLTATRS